ncbi:hypothetical protein AN478_13430 [Thiohalorhabdus denitrificans]|uniref:Uncharacterized conserved protein, DUF433 family n=1 Tax=Thiohalorhabdus denitrificans TaxID=381306 RepID=A0A0P9EK28_9GAMM|nr:DUF433 domain-containing protein [Thiohalorhabdus denitrificans]KPV38929.1 hypothetical protein AN478_13430 [Thiohalorhabdus denitrificans]SCY68312.1 Uncharacterized conserved protein, DUF433 family [Thiohalorhabdus denitrificans]
MTENALERITTDPEVCGGRPCIRGLRIRVTDILELLASGASQDEILEDYPYLQAEDIQAALTYAARQSDHTVIDVA